MSDISPRIDEALDEAVERLTAVMLRWAEDHRGPSHTWVASLADTIVVLVDARGRWGREVELLKPCDECADFQACRDASECGYQRTPESGTTPLEGRHD